MNKKTEKYDVVITNPPYMPVSNASNKLSNFIKEHYPDSKTDLFAVFIECCREMLEDNGYQAMITMHSWMFLSSYEKLREKLLNNVNIVNMVHLGARAFEEIGGEVVQTTSFVLNKSCIKEYKGTYCRLIEPNTQQGKEDIFLAGENRYVAEQSNFSKIPGGPIAYWASNALFKCFVEGILLGKYAPTKKGLDTGENDKYLRYWFEPVFNKFGFNYSSSEAFCFERKKWAPHDKGGDFRRWYGNKEWIINWENNGFELHHSNANLRSERFYFKDAITWGSLSSGKISFRKSDYGALSNTAGSSIYPKKSINNLLAFLNSNVAQYILDIISPTMNYSAGPVSLIPIFQEINIELIETISEQLVMNSRIDWDSFETSWDFKRNPLV